MDNTVRLNMQQRLNNLKHKFLELYQFQDVTENELKTFKNNINSSFYKIQRVLKNSGSIIEDYDRVTMQLIANYEAVLMASSRKISSIGEQKFDDTYNVSIQAFPEITNDDKTKYVPTNIMVYNRLMGTKYSNKYNIYIAASDVVVTQVAVLGLNNDKYKMKDLYPKDYRTMKQVKDIFNTSNVINMSGMFEYCNNLTTLDVSNFNTSNVTDMSGIFRACNSLTTLDVSNFNTSKVTYMFRMFNGCNNLTTLDVSKWDTSKVTNMDGMFWVCNSLTTLDVSNWNTSNVTDMGNMFSYCNNLTTLDVSNWDTSNVINMYSMFNDCNKLTTLDVSNFNTSKVTNMAYMFENCNKLTTLDVSNFKVNADTNISGIIAGCTSLTPSTLKMDSFKNIKFKNAAGLCAGFNSQEMVDYVCGIIDTSENTNFSYMFANISLSNLVVPIIKSSAKSVNMDSMFRYCKSLTSLDVSKWDTSNVTNMGNMFYNCSSLTTLDVSNFNTSNVTDMIAMFYNCRSLATLDVSNFNTSNVTNMGGMFYNCSSLTSLDVSNFNTSNVTNMNNMFISCINLTIITGIIDMKSCTYYNNMFINCSKLKGVKLKNVPSGFDASKAGLSAGQYTIVS